ncbi:MAG TPA: phage major capsid protein [Nitrospira sp.]|nr:phage major capsid protein [Nitrospira sp.]
MATINPILGSGIVPSGNIGDELSYLTRRAFIPRMIVQIYKSSPLISALLANAQMAGGGVNAVTVPVQGASYTTASWSDFSGSFAQPAVTQGAYNAQFNLKLMVVPIPFLGMEGFIQLDHSIVPIIDARMNDATYNAIDTLATALYNNSTNAQQLIGLPAAVDDSTNVTTYAGLSRATYTFWKSQYVGSIGGGKFTRDFLLTYINQLVKATGEAPTFGVCGFGTWTSFATDFTDSERYNYQVGVSPGKNAKASAHFRALEVAGTPLYADPYCPEGTVYLLNTRYLSLYLHRMGAFAFTGFESTLPNFQLGSIAAMVCVLELVCTKPKCQSQLTGMTGYINI